MKHLLTDRCFFWHGEFKKNIKCLIAKIAICVADFKGKGYNYGDKSTCPKTLAKYHKISQKYR